MSRDEAFAARLFAVTYYLQNGYPPALKTTAMVRGVTVGEAYRATATINYRKVAQRLAS